MVRDEGKSGRRWRRMLLCGLTSAALWSQPLAAELVAPREVSASERAAVGLAAEYLTTGPEGWLASLAANSALAHLEAGERRAELEVRFGPAAGAEWRLATPSPAAPAGSVAFSILFPSGLQEFVEMEFVEAGEEWRLLKILSSVDPRPAPLVFDEIETSLVLPVESGWGWTALVTFLAVFSLLAALARGAAQPWRAWQGTAVLLCLVLGCAGPVGEKGSQEVLEAGEPAPTMTRLGALKDLRWQTAGGASASEGSGLEPQEGVLLDVARIWRAEDALLKSKLNTAAILLEDVPAASRYPKAEILRARLANLRNEPVQAYAAYNRARRLDALYDELPWEMVDVLARFDEEGMARANVAFLVDGGSRRAEVHYLNAFLKLLDGWGDDADEVFTQAWELYPRGREQIFTDPTLGSFAARPAILPLLDLGSHEEPKVPAADAGSRPLELGEGVESTLYGRLLVLRTASSALIEVPNGAPIAPQGAEVARARLREFDDYSAALEWLGGQDPAALATAGALDRRRARLAAAALMRKERWEELLELTENLQREGEPVPTELAWFQIAANRGLDRIERAKVELVALAKRGILEQQRDPVVLVALAELFAETEDFETAIRLMKKASALGATVALDSRVRQFALDQALAAAYSSLTTKNFEIRLPQASGKKYAYEVAYVLEEERVRLQHWIPIAKGEKIEVHLFPFMEFITTFSDGIPVAGLYDGKVRLPLADLRSLHPILVATLSHEVAHAMIDIRSSGRAPKWFHEGLAQHIQMADQPLNYLTELRAASRSVALPALEPILRGFSEPQFVQMAYGQAAWLAHYLEVRSGPRVFAQLMDAFARGLDSEAAVSEVTGVPYAEFEEGFWHWATRVAPKAWKAEPRRYDREMKMAELAGFHPGVETPGSAPLGSVGPPPPTTAEVRRQRMAAWHQRYLPEVRPVKSALGEVLNILGGSSQSNLKDACRALDKRLDTILRSRGALDSPNPDVNASLRQAFTDLKAGVVGCQSGSTMALRRGIDRGQARLATAARVLAQFGLQP